MNTSLRKSRILLASLTAMGLAMGGWLTTPAMAATGGFAAGDCCQAKAATQCCGRACCQTPAPNPLQWPLDPSPTFSEGPRDGNLGWAGFALPRANDAQPSPRLACRLALLDTSDQSLIAQHVRLQI